MLLAGVLVTGAAGLAQAQENLVVSEFPDADSVTAWSRWWGAAAQTYEWDGTVNQPADPSSGSLKATIEFDLATHAGENQFALQGNLPETADGTKYTNLVMDIRWDANSPKTPGGDFGYLEYGLKTADASQIWLGGQAITGSDWIHIEAPIDPALNKLDQVNGVVLKLWSGDPSSGMTGTTAFWLDNVVLVASTNAAPPPPPSLSLASAEPGLQLFASAGGAQYQRQNIRTVGGDYSWVGQGQPVTYSLAVAGYPDAAHSGFQTHVFLVPADSPPTESAPDWNRPNVVFLEIGNNADGGAYANLRHKTNQPNGNTMLFNGDPDNGPVGQLASVGSATPLGTWTLTFANDTDFTLTAPDGSSTTGQFPANSAALFAGPLYAFFGVQPNQLGNIGQSAIFSEVKITGVPTPLEDDFAGVPPDDGGPNRLNPEVWQVVAEDPSGRRPRAAGHRVVGVVDAARQRLCARAEHGGGRRLGAVGDDPGPGRFAAGRTASGQQPACRRQRLLPPREAGVSRRVRAGSTRGTGFPAPRLRFRAAGRRTRASGVLARAVPP